MMIDGSLVRRLDRLEAELAPPGDPRVLKIHVTGEPDEIIELCIDQPTRGPPRNRQHYFCGIARQTPRRGLNRWPYIRAPALERMKK